MNRQKTDLTPSDYIVEDICSGTSNNNIHIILSDGTSYFLSQYDISRNQLNEPHRLPGKPLNNIRTSGKNSENVLIEIESSKNDLLRYIRIGSNDAAPTYREAHLNSSGSILGILSDLSKPIVTYKDKNLQALGVFCEETEDIRPITGNNELFVGGGIPSPDRKKIVYLSLSGKGLTLDLKLHDFTSGKTDKVRSFQKEYPINMICWLHDSEQLLFTRSLEQGDELSLLDVLNGEVRVVCKEKHVVGACVSKDHNYIAALEHHEASIIPVLYSVSSGEKLGLPARQFKQGVARRVFFSNDNRSLVFIWEDPSQRPAVRKVDLFGAPNQITTTFNNKSAILDRVKHDTTYSAISSEHIFISAPDNVKIPVLVHRNKSKSPRRLIISLHGGPAAQAQNNYDVVRKMLVERGYLVAEVNYRGSTGYGKSFCGLNLKDWAGGDLSDIIESTKYMQKRHGFNATETTVMGGSYGAFLALWCIIKHSEYFDSASLWFGFYDLHALHNSSVDIIRRMLLFYLGDPSSNAGLWNERSPINHIEKLARKMLIVHGEEDVICPFSQLQSLCEQLDRVGSVRQSDYYVKILKNKGHGAGCQDSKVACAKLLMEFIENPGASDGYMDEYFYNEFSDIHGTCSEKKSGVATN